MYTIFKKIFLKDILRVMTFSFICGPSVSWKSIFFKKLKK